MKFPKDSKLLLLALTLFVIGSAYVSAIAIAQTDTEKSVDEVMQEITRAQGITNTNQIVCSKVTDSQFEDLGDALMERMIGNHQLHEQMDIMMGGEGSQSLAQMHIAMGENWIECSKGSADFQGMMSSGGMMGMMPMMMNMMGYYYPAYFANYNTMLVIGTIGWILFFILLVVVALMWSGKIKIQKRRK